MDGGNVGEGAGVCMEVKPCRAFRNLSVAEQYAKIYEEVKEVGQAINGKDRDNLIEEVGDVITSCVTMLDMLGVNAVERGALYGRINQKNAARGYFDAPDDDVKMQRNSWIMNRMMRRD